MPELVETSSTGFAGQIRRTARAGLVALMLGAILMTLALLSVGDAADAFALAATAGLAVAAMLWLGGCLCRSLHKRLYHAVLEQNDLWRGLHARSRLARLWLWLDPAGYDRDA